MTDDLFKGRVGVVTSARADFGYYFPILQKIRERIGDRLDIVATGMHLASSFGLTVTQLDDNGFSPTFRIETQLASDTPEGIGKSIGVGTASFAQLFSHWRPEILIVHGDRFDMLPAVLAALPWRIPIAHIGGGELTEGVIDDPIRHAITKMSHLHFVETKQAERVVLGLGEEKWRITVCGAVSIDSIQSTPAISRADLVERFGIPADEPYLLCTFHPEALEPQIIVRQTADLLRSIHDSGLPCIFSETNADAHGGIITAAVQRFCAANPCHRIAEKANLSEYYSLMAGATAMIGNSSSGIVESPAFALPTVNVGGRQTGRPRAINVLDCAAEHSAISNALTQAVSPAFRASLASLVNPYGEGRAADTLVEGLFRLISDRRLLNKKMQFDAR